MKKTLAALALIAFAVTGCDHGQRITALETRVTAVEGEHTATRQKLQDLLVWINQTAPPRVGLYEWVKAVHAKVFPPGPTDPNPPSSPPPPF